MPPACSWEGRNRARHPSPLAHPCPGPGNDHQQRGSCRQGGKAQRIRPRGSAPHLASSLPRSPSRCPVEHVSTPSSPPERHPGGSADAELRNRPGVRLARVPVYQRACNEGAVDCPAWLITHQATAKGEGSRDHRWRSVWGESTSKERGQCRWELSVGSRVERGLPFPDCGGRRGEYEGIPTGMVWLGPSRGADSPAAKI